MNLMIRPARCYTCSHDFEVEANEVNGPLPCPKCDSNSYYTDSKGSTYVQVLEVKEPIPECTRQLKHAEVRS